MMENVFNAPQLSGNFKKELLQEAADRFGTPLYVYDLSLIHI